MNNLYKHIDVWQRTSRESLMRFVCFQNIETGKFIVQQGVSYKAKYLHTEKFRDHLEWDTLNFYEGLFDAKPEDRLSEDEPPEGYDSLKEAIIGWCNKWGM